MTIWRPASHLEPDQLREVLSQLGHGADLDASGTPISTELLYQILRAISGVNEGPPTFGNAWFLQAHFTQGATFTGVIFNGDTSFQDTQFSGETSFQKAQFNGRVSFDNARFNGKAWFGGANFGENTGRRGHKEIDPPM